MNKNLQSLHLVVLLAFSTLFYPLFSSYAQDTLYIYQGGSVVIKRAILQVDSMTFTAPPIPVTPVCGAYIAPDVWKVFMCHNLGANTALDPMTYSTGINGDLYQWGRPSDGHEKRTSTTTSTLATTNTPGHSILIIPPSSPYDWRSGGGNDTRWTDDSKSINDPCPTGYKVPSERQWAGVVANNTKSTWANGYKFGTDLFLPAAGTRSGVTGVLQNVGSYSGYWSSTASNVYAYGLRLGDGSVELADYNLRANSASVRCIAEDAVAINTPTLTTTTSTAITATTANSGGSIATDGGASVSARGVCWSTSTNPTVSLSTKTIDGSGNGSFTSVITGLTANTLYYVRAYATNSAGTAYGAQINFTTSAASIASNCGAYTAPGVYKQFLCKNLGAAGDLFSGGLTYNAADNGDLYQWGRPTDGHEKRTNNTTSTLATSNTPSNSSFITTSASPWDWRSGGGNDSRWTDATKATNDPCPTGYKVPSKVQWAGVLANNTKGVWTNGYKFGDKLFLPASGYRDIAVGSLYGVGLGGNYWSSTVLDTIGFSFGFDSNLVNAADSNYRAYGMSIRCVAE